MKYCFKAFYGTDPATPLDRIMSMRTRAGHFSSLEVGIMLVCIDPGHGIETAGKRSFDGTLREYEFNRDVARRLKKYLELAGVKVILSAPTDADVPLAERCRIANEAKADAFVSIHANAYGSTWNDARGWEIYIWKHGGQAEKIAEAIRSESIPLLGLKDRGVKEENFYVLRETNMPAVLIEHGFYTNLYECELLKSDAFRERCAVADAKGILKWAGKPFVAAPAGTPILGNPQATVGQAQAWARKRGATEEFVNLANLYWSLCSGIVRPEVAYAQAAKETGFGRFGGAVTPDMHNPCGLKITNPKGDAREDHAKFPDWLTGVKAHRDHLALYAGTPGYPATNTPDPRHFASIKGTAPYVESLGGKWAPSQDYGKSIVKDYLDDLMTTEDGSAPRPPLPPVDPPPVQPPGQGTDRLPVVLVPNAKMANVNIELWYGDGFAGRGLYLHDDGWHLVWAKPRE